MSGSPFGNLGTFGNVTSDYSQAVARAVQQLAGEPAGNGFVGGLVLDHAAEVELPPEVLLSPEMLFAHLRSSLRDLDGQIRGQLKLLEDNREAITRASETLTRLRGDQSNARNFEGPERTANDGVAITDDNRQEYVDLLVSAGLTQGDAENMVSGWGDHANVENFQNAIDAVNDRVSELNSSNEYQMLQVNELMSKRSNLIQLVSKILGNMNETAQSVIQNMR
jgi:hypothetical protein